MLTWLKKLFWGGPPTPADVSTDPIELDGWRISMTSFAAVGMAAGQVIGCQPVQLWRRGKVLVFIPLTPATGEPSRN